MKERAEIPEWEVTIDAEGRVSFAHPKQARAWLKHKHAGEVLVAQFYPHRTKRSDRQNRGGHALFSEWLRHKEGWTLGSLKLYALGQCFGYLEVAHPVTGEVLLFPAKPHTSELSMGEFCELIEWILEHAAEEDGVALVAPDEYRRQREALAKREARKAMREVA
ncbi:MAG: hypothetical protein IT348_05850 [Candidatus Eisenbacteria bacterium]|nr:hypothetical protein [Candidatus Eisenbacteria bacterium]